VTILSQQETPLFKNRTIRFISEIRQCRWLRSNLRSLGVYPDKVSSRLFLNVGAYLPCYAAFHFSLRI